jgi:hypothetical protein
MSRGYNNGGTEKDIVKSHKRLNEGGAQILGKDWEGDGNSDNDDDRKDNA